MQVRIAHDAPAAARTGALVVPIFSGSELSGAAKSVDDALGGAIADVLSSGEIKGKLAEIAFIHAKDQPFHRVLVVGLGDAAKFEPHMLARYAGTAVRYLGRRKVTEIAIALPEQAKSQAAAAASFASEGALSGSFDTSIYQGENEKKNTVETVTILAGDADAKALDEGLRRGTALGEAVNFARRLALTPANDMTPTILADEAVKAGKQSGLNVEVWDEARARQEKMGSFLSVAQGSVQPPKFIIMRYEGDPGNKELLALVGKGITFDTGGISIKPAERMEEM
ncbi:MAG TPA: M17 family peptidase N-terminal domain-containing protein, partial [Candidatus Aquilonibacter sp.]|nr:M17 family peptidase N-terminal domain-containing protein [Candidatus Aquilonibacter sp.]